LLCSSQLIFGGSIWAWTKKSFSLYDSCPPQKVISTSKSIDSRSSRKRRVSHSCFSYKHYHHFSDHDHVHITSSTMNWKKLGILWNFTSMFSTLLYFIESTWRASFQNILTKICSFKVWYLVFPLIQMKLQTQISTKLCAQIIWIFLRCSLSMWTSRSYTYSLFHLKKKWAKKLLKLWQFGPIFRKYIPLGHQGLMTLHVGIKLNPSN